MGSTWGACGLLLLTMAAASGGRNAAGYFREARFQHSPSRPEDALVLFTVGAPPLICEPDTSGVCRSIVYVGGGFCFSLPHGFSRYLCSFDGNGTMDSYLELTEDILTIDQSVFGNGRWARKLKEERMYCTANSQLPDEYFHVGVQRPHEDRLINCHFLNDSGAFHLRFPGYPTVTCYVGDEAGRYQFTLPGVDERFRCAFRVYSELRLGDTHTEQRLHQSLIGGLPARVDGARPRVECFRRADANAAPGTRADYQLQLLSGATYDCSFPDAAVCSQPQSQHTTQD